MDVNFELGDLKFVWDSEKADKNWKKHKIKFQSAAMVFLDDYKIDVYDEEHSENEDRFKIIGMVEKVLVVIYTDREDMYRIISARQATKFERDEYYEQFNLV
jgi:uncharacterized DUF497 family protein